MIRTVAWISTLFGFYMVIILGDLSMFGFVAFGAALHCKADIDELEKKIK